MSDKTLSVTATDLEVELVAQVDVDVKEKGEVTVPARKLLDICRSLPEGAKISLSLERERVTAEVRSQSLPPGHPASSGIPGSGRHQVPAQREPGPEEAAGTHRTDPFLHGPAGCALLPERPAVRALSAKRIRAVATDGHRLAMCDLEADVADLPAQQVIVPRKGVLELQRLADG